MYHRIEHDSLGEMQVPESVYYGIQTLRALRNFPITGIQIRRFPNLIKALACIKEAAASANMELGLLDQKIGNAIIQAANEVKAGKFHEHFVLDVVQGGAGTSTNMNANEVIANRAIELLGHTRGEYKFCHPNNHVNLSQSTNDVYPTALKFAAIWSIQELVQAMENLHEAFASKGKEFEKILKIGRTQLQDAVPMTLGQEFMAFAVTIGEDIERIREACCLMHEINMGATAIGTGILTVKGYSDCVREHLIRITGLPLITSPNLVEATSDPGSFVQISGVLKRVAVKLSTISSDLRLLSSGPRAGLGEIHLPPVQPGSSIMPGKVNPVIPEVVNQVCFQIIGNDVAISMAASSGQLELNAFEPIIGFNLFFSVHMLKQAVTVLKDRCITGIKANREQCYKHLENSIGLATALVPYIGYEAAANIAKESLKTGQKIIDIAKTSGLLDEEILNKIMDPDNMTRPYENL